MNSNDLQNKFERMGARIRVEPFRGRPGSEWPARVDIRRDRRGEYFHIAVNPQRMISLEVLDVQPTQRHLLLMVRQRPTSAAGAADDPLKRKFLCGHDERAWFVAAVPEKAAASTVRTAMEALKPAGVLASQSRVRLKARDWQRRKNRAFVRQGEWFFVPQPHLVINAKVVLLNEPLRRGAGKPHCAEYCVRLGGESVYVSHLAPNGLTEGEYKRWMDANPQQRQSVRWNRMTRNARVYVRGRVRHPDHKTIVLNGWHEVHMNTETQAQAMAHVAFLD